jgi:hypothetical protein
MQDLHTIGTQFAAECCIHARTDHFGIMSETEPQPEPAPTPQPPAPPALPPEIGGAEGPEPTRYGDWSHKGRCTDF